MFVIQVACGLYLLLVPFAFSLLGGGSTAHDFSRVAELPLLALAATMLIRAGMPGPTVPAMFKRLLFCMAILAGLSALHAAVPAVALRELVLFGGLFALMLVLAAAERQRELMSYFVLGAAVSYSLVLLVVLLTAQAAGQVVLVWELPVGFDNPRFFNHVQTAMIPVLASLALRRAWPRRLRQLAFASLVLQCFFLVATTGRASMLAIATAALVLWLIIGARANPWLGRLVLAAAIGLLCYWLLARLGPGLAETTGYQPNARELSSSHSRDYLWRIAAREAAAAPVLGQGPMHFAHQVNAKGAHPHNLYLQVAAEFGLPFTLIGLYVVLRSMRAMVIQLRAGAASDAMVMGAGLFAACIAIGIDALFSGNLVMPNSQVWCFAVFGMSYAWYADAAGADKPVGHLSWRETLVPTSARLLQIGAAALVLWLNFVSLPEARLEVPHLVVNPKVDESAHVQQSMRPRFWSQGWF